MYMAYTSNPHMGKVRRDAVRLVKYRGWSVRQAALRYGVAPSTVSRWCRHPRGTGWDEIPTASSRPHASPRALSEGTVMRILAKRSGRRRCGQVIHAELMREGTAVSLSSVQRTLDRCGLLKKRSPWKRPHDATPRPFPAREGALLQADTVHLTALDGTRQYVYTLIDLFSRWAYAEVAERIGAEASVQFLLRARHAAPFSFTMVQTDHGSEFSTWFTHALLRRGIAHRHSRVRQANDNAHVERFNRTLQEECLDRTVPTVSALQAAIASYLPYYNGIRLHMGLNYQTPFEVLRRS